MKKRVAVIGSGIAGMASAYYLREGFDVTVYEKDNYIGGHTNTVEVQAGSKRLPIDTGFMVFNHKTYPNLLKLFAELEVESYDTSMSFGVQNVDTGLEFACSGFSSYFAQRRNIFSPSHWSLYREMLRYFEAADVALSRENESCYTLANFIAEFELSDAVVKNLIVPMAAAIWSTPFGKMLDYPADALLGFLKNHQMLGVGVQLQWKTVKGGSRSYREKLLAKLPKRVRPLTGAASVEVTADGKAEVTAMSGARALYDFAVIGTHADEALALLKTPTPLQERLLSQLKYNTNPVVLHSDESVMPKSRGAWASWNFRFQSPPDRTGERSSTHYWMNSLQKVDDSKNYFVSVDYEGTIRPEKIHWSKTYHHPRYDTKAIRAQKQLPELNAQGPVFFCGSYFKHGFHEDALTAAIGATNALKERSENSCEILPL